MKMLSECSGECCVCACGDLCLAGHGDDDFSPASKEKIIENLDYGKYPNYTNYMIEQLANKYKYDYDIRNVGSKQRDKTNGSEWEKAFNYLWNKHIEEFNYYMNIDKSRSI